ncbi:MAG: YicC family protein [Planctomycetes bacterium]|nr:YicC family protein [Planctomycetota bacterium]
MTGFGSASYEDAELRGRVEVRSVNNRFFKLNTKVPDLLYPSLHEVEALVKSRLERGTIYLSIYVDLLAPPLEYVLDRRAIAAYRRELDAIQQELRIPGEVGIGVLAVLPGAVRPAREEALDGEGIWERLRPVAGEALDALQAMRGREGGRVRDEVLLRCETIREGLRAVEARLPAVVREYQERLHRRVQALLAGVETKLAPEDLAREVALYADKSDVSEELQRLRSHVDEVVAACEGPEAAGRRLEFIVQEMFREANTMASKSGDSELVRHVLGIKSEVDRIKEQTQNIE